VSLTTPVDHGVADKDASRYEEEKTDKSRRLDISRAYPVVRPKKVRETKDPKWIHSSLRPLRRLPTPFAVSVQVYGAECWNSGGFLVEFWQGSALDVCFIKLTQGTHGSFHYYSRWMVFRQAEKRIGIYLAELIRVEFQHIPFEPESLYF
jgi:hypothetical protein